MRLLDVIRRDGSQYWEGLASGAAVLTTTYGNPNNEPILPQVAGWAQQANASNSPVFAAIVVRMQMFAEAEFCLLRPDGGTYTNQSLALLQEPWPRGTESELKARMLQDGDVAGNAYIWNNNQERLVRLRPDWVTIVSELVRVPGGGSYRQKIGYWFEPPKSAVGEAEPEFYPADEVAHWAPLPDPQANFRGMSWLTPAYREINADSGLTQYKIKYLEHNASPNVVIRYAQKLQPGTIDQLRERMQARYGGVDNAFKTLILDQGADLTIVGNTLQQMDYANVQQVGVDRILADAGVPPVLVGLEPIKGAGKSYEDVVRRFGDLTMRPLWRSGCGALQTIIPEIQRPIRLWVDLGSVAALQEAEQTRAQVALIRAQALLTLAQAGYTRESSVAMVEADDVSKLVDSGEPLPVAGANAGQAQPAVQHMLPQGQPGATAKPLPAALPRLTVGSVSPGDGGNGTRPAPRPSGARRAIEGEHGPELLGLPAGSTVYPNG